ncbi:MAG: DNA mismatch repair endonuclease MutL [Desulfovibrio sp.]
MSNRRTIKLLPPALKNQIAAGEVVERPASVIKELVENCLDAGSTRVDVAVKRGGQGLILVQDNGHGIGAEELPLAVTRHATSKIDNVADLAKISSFGFRGEALPSIASVSHFIMTSKADDEDEAAFVEVDGGEVKDSGPAALAAGTRVEIKDLFSVVPARLKFLKTEATETRRCQDILFRMSLAHLHVGFSWTVNDKEQFRLPAGQELVARVAQFWPPKIAENLLPLEHEQGCCKIHGLTGIPATAQGRADRMVLYVNGRPVQDKLMMRAVREGYRGKLISREYPQVVLFLELPHDEVDVNVHPSKQEVRFIHEREVFSAIRQAVSLALIRYDTASGIDGALGKGSEAAMTPIARPEHAPKPASLPIMNKQKPQTPEEDSEWEFSGAKKIPPTSTGLSLFEDDHDTDVQSFQNGQASESQPLERKEYSVREPHASSHMQTPMQSPPPQYDDDYFAGAASQDYESSRNPNVNVTTAPVMNLGNITYMGQFDDTYLIVSTGKDLWLIDQHAAHERIIYEAKKKERTKGDSQPLAIPLELSLHPEEAEALQDFWEDFQKAGFRLKTEGDTKVFVTGVPPTLSAGESKDILRAALTGKEKGLDDMWIMMSCKTAIKARQPLAADEALALLETWLETPQKEYCPHGRPVLVKWNVTEIEKLFKRK